MPAQGQLADQSSYLSAASCMLGYAKKFACVLVVGQPRHGLDMFFCASRLFCFIHIWFVAAGAR